MFYIHLILRVSRQKKDELQTKLDQEALSQNKLHDEKLKLLKELARRSNNSTRHSSESSKTTALGSQASQQKRDWRELQNTFCDNAPWDSVNLSKVWAPEMPSGSYDWFF
jgi:hypothetical protein